MVSIGAPEGAVRIAGFRLSARVAALGSAIAMLLAMLLATTPAIAHQPVQLTSADRTPASGPLLVDGTVSFAVYATVRDGATRGFRVGMREGQRLDIQLLIPDRAPVNRLSSSRLPLVTVVDPAGRRTTLTIDERTPFYEPYSGTSYLYLARLSQSARSGTYQVIVTGRDRAKVPVVIGVGYREVPGTVRD
ncbi:MAG: hypothetical protein RLZ94_1405 [Actinomycetota bacterium]